MRHTTPVVPLALGLASTLVYLAGPAAGLHLEFSRVAIDDGEAWRLITGHLTHGNLAHLVWNLAALALIAALITPATRLVCATVAITLVTSLGLLIVAPDLNTYRGMSGLSYGLFCCAMVSRAFDDSIRWLVPALTVALWALIDTLDEQRHLHGLPVEARAHLLGCLAGTVYAIIAGSQGARAVDHATISSDG